MRREFEHVGRCRNNTGGDRCDGGANDGVGGCWRDAEFYSDREQR
jgi:hypothetical protein